MGAQQPVALEVSLHHDVPRGWNPEPLRLCMVPRRLQRRFLSACTATLHNADYINKLVPHAVEDWINYHLLIGVEHFTLFDTDGTFEPYVRSFMEKGLVTYHGNFPAKVSPKLGLLAAGLRSGTQRRSMALEPHAIEMCVWENRHVSDWVVVIHSFEEFLHSPEFVDRLGHFSLTLALRRWSQDVPDTAVFEFFQEPMGGPLPHRPRSARSVLSAWPWKRGLDLEEMAEQEGIEAVQGHTQPFAWIADTLNVAQTAVHFAQARAFGQKVVFLPQSTLRVNHYVDFGSNTSRCLEELGGCTVRDDSIIWAEDAVIRMRRRSVAKNAQI